MKGPEFTEEPQITQIVLDEEKKAALTDKLADYEWRQRDLAFKAPEQLSPGDPQSIKYKLELTKALLADGSLDVQAMRERFQSEEGGNFKPEIFDKAVRVIDAYNTGKTVYGGSGFGKRRG